jgi:hypothetical protein
MKIKIIDFDSNTKTIPMNISNYFVQDFVRDENNVNSDWESKVILKKYLMNIACMATVMI